MHAHDGMVCASVTRQATDSAACRQQACSVSMPWHVRAPRAWDGPWASTSSAAQGQMAWYGAAAPRPMQACTHPMQRPRRLCCSHAACPAELTCPHIGRGLARSEGQVVGEGEAVARAQGAHLMLAVCRMVWRRAGKPVICMCGCSLLACRHDTHMATCTPPVHACRQAHAAISLASNSNQTRLHRKRRTRCRWGGLAAPAQTCARHETPPALHPVPGKCMACRSAGTVCMAWHDAAAHDMVWHYAMHASHGMAWLGWHGIAWLIGQRCGHGMAWHGMAWPD